jgi:D-xylose transport system substrate-binding protein
MTLRLPIRRKLPAKRAAASLAAISAFALAACGGSSSASNSTTSAGSTTSASASASTLTASSFTSDFSAMGQLTSLAAQGKGMVGVLLPDTTSSARYVSFDAPYLTKAFQAAGFTQSKVDNAQGSATTMQTQAEADITQGATVLILDAIDSGSGAAIENMAASKGVKVIDYDRLTLGGAADRYYVSFDNVKVGELIGQGLVSCVSAWKVVIRTFS